VHGHDFGVGAAFPVVELAHVVVARLAVQPGYPLPTEEDIRCGLHETLSRDDAAAMVRVLARTGEGLEYRCPSLLRLKDQRVVLVASDQQEDVATGANASHTHDLACGVHITEFLERVVFDQRVPIRGQQLLDDDVGLLPLRTGNDQIPENVQTVRAGGPPLTAGSVALDDT
jgi:hypothetical protein